MPKALLSLDTKPGIQRDGTVLDKLTYNDGEWVRFQRGKPRKISGYREITDEMHGPSRGIHVDSADGINRIFNGFPEGMEKVSVDADGIGSGLTTYDLAAGPVLTLTITDPGSGLTDGVYPGVSATGNTGFGATFTVTVAGGIVTNITLTNSGNGYQQTLGIPDLLMTIPVSSIGGIGTSPLISIDVVAAAFVADERTLWQMDGYFDATGDGINLIVAHPGQNLVSIDNTTETAVLAFDPAGVISPTLVNPPMYPLTDTQGTTPTGDTIMVSGGVVVLHPYIFVYGDNGLIKNNSAGNAFDWNSPDSNEANVSAQKIVKGLAVRGGSNSPSGLFWAMDSLIKVSFAPSTVGPDTIFWRYDVIGTSTILSSQSVIEYDGIYYWAGIDRFLLYNGVIKELPNEININWFLDALNFAQRQKVWVNKVPKFGEIWWFYPRGDATECTDVIIYNVRMDTWYDTGSAPGSQRSAGYYAQGFRYPVNAGTELTIETVVVTQLITTTAASFFIDTAVNMNIAVGQLVQGSGIPANSFVQTISVIPAGYHIRLSKAATFSTTAQATFSTTGNRISLWQHEFGTNEIKGQNITAIRSMFETDNIGLVTGGPSQSGLQGENKWLHLDSVEPDFRQTGVMEMFVTGRPYAQQDDVTSQPFPFEPNTGKIDLRQQRRELRLRFVSNVQDGSYQLGRLQLLVDAGDVRGFKE
jgi:hypothetical protein